VEIAADHDRTAGREYGRANTQARRAARFYSIARGLRLTLRFAAPQDAAELELTCQLMVRCADAMLASSFSATDNARFYAKLARDYRKMVS
jgi:hypothetical protein